MVKILCHRGFHCNNGISYQNKIKTCQIAKDFNFGIEIDVRIQNKKIILSHDKTNQTVDDFKSLLENLNITKKSKWFTIAINIKEPNMARIIHQMMLPYQNLINWFVFDFPISETAEYFNIFRKKHIAYSHLSDDNNYTKEGIFFENIWIYDYELDIIKISKNYYKCGKKVWIVSPEVVLSNKVQILKNIYKIIENKNIFVGVCTDLPCLYRKYL